MSICEKLKLGELRPTKMSIQFADRSVKYPLCILENVPVRVGQFFIPTDFIVMDIREDSKTPIILGRPFLATVCALIDVKKGKLTFEVGEEKVEFIPTQFMKAPTIDDECYMLEVIEECRKKMDQTTYSEVQKTPTPIPQTHKSDDDGLGECLEITSDHMSCPVKHTLELKTPPGFQKGAPAAPNIPTKSNLELIMENFVLAQTQLNEEFTNQNIHINESIKQLVNIVDLMATHNKMLETQISQVAQQLAATATPAETFPGQSQPNPKGHVNAITLQSGTELEGPVATRVRGQYIEKSIDREPIIVEDIQTSKVKEVVQNDQEKTYIPATPYKPFKRVPLDILKAHPESNIFQDKTPPFVSKKKKGKRKTPMRWFDMFKWRPKDVGHNFKNVSLEEAPF
jgi:hypothetical protein